LIVDNLAFLSVARRVTEFNLLISRHLLLLLPLLQVVLVTQLMYRLSIVVCLQPVGAERAPPGHVTSSVTSSSCRRWRWPFEFVRSTVASWRATASASLPCRTTRPVRARLTHRTYARRLRSAFAYDFTKCWSIFKILLPTH